MPTPRKVVLDLLKDLVCLCIPNLHICVTSRPEIDIKRALEPLPHTAVSLHDESGQKEDISDYVNSVVYSDGRCGAGGMKRRSWLSRSCLIKRTECESALLCLAINPYRFFFVQVPMGILSA